MYKSDIRLITKYKGLDIIQELCKKENKELLDILKSKETIKENISDLVYIGWDNMNGYDADFIENALISLNEQDITYKVAIKGEKYEDINMYEYISENDKDRNIPMPYIERIFNEDEMKEELQKIKEQDKLSEFETIDY